MKKIFITLIPALMFIAFSASLCACSDDKVEEPEETMPPVPSPGDDGEACAVALSLDIDQINELSATENNSEYRIKTNGGHDPWIYTKQLPKDLTEEAVVLAFDYKSSRAVDGLQAYLCPPLDGERNVGLGSLEASPGSWKSFSAVIGESFKEFSWGKAGDMLRLDFGDGTEALIIIRNLRIRGLNAEERNSQQTEEEYLASLNTLDERLADYLCRSFSSQISMVEVTSDQVNISGTANGGTLALAEVTPYQNALLLTSFHKCKTGLSGSFNVSIPRFTEYDGFRYDRLLSKFVLVKTTNGKDEIASACRYVDADHIDQSKAIGCQDVPSDIKKGGEAVNGKVYDAVEMGMKVTLVGIPVTAVMWRSAAAAAAVGDQVIQHRYMGKTYYFSRGYFEDIVDKHLIELQNAGISVFTVITLRPETPNDPTAYKNYDHELGLLLQHPDYTGQGTFAMVNLTQAESVNYMAAALDFLASRYSDGSHGRIHRYVMHNEIDDPNNWNDCGWKPQRVYMDQFVKSTRMAHNIIRQYNSYAQILVPVTQQWTFQKTHPAHNMSFAVRDLFSLINDFSRVEGDYYWGVGYHSYPQKFQNRTWEDDLATWSMNTEYITFKNLEVLDKWAKTSANMYKGTKMRDVWLTENGSSTPTYSETELTEQAACAAYAYKKVNKLSAIQTLIWHASTDNDVEGNLNLGLHYRENYAPDPWGRKPAWYAIQAIGTTRESQVIDRYLPIIGVSNWDEIMHQVND